MAIVEEHIEDSQSKRHSKHIPQRTCIACRRVGDKQDLIRLVRTHSGRTEVDLTGKADGRGAYLCREWECWKKVFKKNQLERALQGKITQENCVSLMEWGKALLLTNKDDR